MIIQNGGVACWREQSQMLRVDICGPIRER